MPEIYPSSDRHEKARQWVTDAQAALYEEELQVRMNLLALFPHSPLRDTLHPEDVESIHDLKRVTRDMLDSNHGTDILAILQARREAFEAATGVEVIAEQVAALGLVASLVENPTRPLPTFDHAERFIS